MIFNPLQPMVTLSAQKIISFKCLTYHTNGLYQWNKPCINTSPQSVVCESKEQVSESVSFQSVCLACFPQIFSTLSDLLPSCLPTNTCTPTSGLIYFEALCDQQRKSKGLFLAELFK